MDKDILNNIYNITQMGIVGINDVLYKVKDKRLLKEIQKEKNDYELILKEVHKLLNSHKVKPTEISFIAKMSSELLSSMKLMKDNSDKEIIKMMIDGTYKGKTSLDKKIIDIDNINDKNMQIAKRLSKLMEDSISKLKKIDIVIE